MSEEKTEKERRNKSGQFPKGVSGNPAGRPKGAKNKTTILKEYVESQLTEQLSMDAQELLGTAIKLAKAGDTTMLKVLLDRLLPARKAEDGRGSKGKSQIVVNISQYTKDEKLVLEGETIDESNDESNEEVIEEVID